MSAHADWLYAELEKADLADVPIEDPDDIEKLLRLLRKLVTGANAQLPRCAEVSADLGQCMRRNGHGGPHANRDADGSVYWLGSLYGAYQVFKDLERKRAAEELREQDGF